MAYQGGYEVNNKGYGGIYVSQSNLLDIPKLKQLSTNLAERL